MPRKHWIHIVPHHAGWAVMREQSYKVTSVHRTQADAIAHGRKLARKAKVELFIHDRHGRILLRDSYGNDPFPPRG